MKNDIWYVGNGYWVAYSEDSEIIAEFKNSKEMQLSATYFHYRKGGIRAAQFNFHQGKEMRRGQCLLSYVCSRMHFDFAAALALYRNNDSTPYSAKYPRNTYQLELFSECRALTPVKKIKKKNEDKST